MATAFTRLTKAGAILCAKALAGNQLTFTRGAFGDAAGAAAPTEKQIDNLTALLNEKISLAIADFKIENYQAVVSLLVTNAKVKKGFRIAEGGLFAQDPETGNEVLYSYFYDGDDGSYLPAGGGAVLLEYYYDLITAVGNAANVTAIIDKSTVSVSREEFEAHCAEFETHCVEFNNHVTNFNNHVISENPHPNFQLASENQCGVIKVGKNLYMTQDSLNAAAASTDEFDARLKQIEINQANLYMLLQKDFSFGEKSNLQQVENFDPVSSTDTYAAQVYTTPSLKYLRIFEPGYLRVGGWFTVTNGRLNQEQTFVKSFAKWGDYDTPYIAKLNAALENEYPSTLTNYLYRSSVTIRDNKAYGAGEIKTRSQIGALTWKGEGNNDSQQIQFNAFASLESSFELEGDWSLTSDGYFTVG